jgi:hypothetical protein
LVIFYPAAEAGPFEIRLKNDKKRLSLMLKFWKFRQSNPHHGNPIML